MARDIRVFPVLLGGADIPDVVQLPEPLVPLTQCNAYEISDLRFHTYVDRLIQALEEIVDVKKPLEQTKQNKKTTIIAIISIMALVIVIVIISNPGENITRQPMTATLLFIRVQVTSIRAVKVGNNSLAIYTTNGDVMINHTS